MGFPKIPWVHFLCICLFSLNFLFHMEVQLINHVLIVSDAQQSDSAIHTCASFSPRPSSHPGCHITSSSPLCYTVVLWVIILDTEVCTGPPHTP